METYPCSLGVHSRENGCFFFKFGDGNECDRILQGGPWLFDGRLIVLRRWHEHIGLERDLLSILKLWSKNIISRIASLVGTPLYMDRATATGERISYAGVFVEIRADKDLKKKVKLSIEPTVSTSSVNNKKGKKGLLAEEPDERKRSVLSGIAMGLHNDKEEIQEISPTNSEGLNEGSTKMDSDTDIDSPSECVPRAKHNERNYQHLKEYVNTTSTSSSPSRNGDRYERRNTKEQGRSTSSATKQNTDINEDIFAGTIATDNPQWDQELLNSKHGDQKGSKAVNRHKQVHTSGPLRRSTRVNEGKLTLPK